MSGLVSKYLRSLYGFDTDIRFNPVTDSVGVTPTQITRQNPNRAAIWITNLSAASLYVLPAKDVSSSKGIYVAPNGGTNIFQINDDFSIPTLAFYAIASLAASNILVQEVIML